MAVNRFPKMHALVDDYRPLYNFSFNQQPGASTIRVVLPRTEVSTQKLKLPHAQHEYMNQQFQPGHLPCRNYLKHLPYFLQY